MNKQTIIETKINPLLDKALEKADKSKRLEDEINYFIHNIKEKIATEEIKFIGEK